MTEDERLAHAIETLQNADLDLVFDELWKIADQFGWELSHRDPGPDTEIDTFSDVWPTEPLGWFRLAGLEP